MKLTIIEAGRPPEPIVRDFPGYPAMLQGLLGPYVPRLLCEVVSVVDGDALPVHDGIEAVLITGSPVGVYDDVAWIGPLKAWIRAGAERAIPQVGICFGHQLIAEAFGGHAQKAPVGWGIGRHSYNVSAQEAWMGEVPDEISLAVSHQDQVLIAPSGARVIASSDFTPHAALIYDHAPVLSFQGHPEFCQGFADALIRSRRGTRFPEDLADIALESLRQPLDGDIVGRWIAGFYRHHQHSAITLQRAAA